MLSLTAILRAESFCLSRASCCLRKRFCSLRSQIFFTVKMVNSCGKQGILSNLASFNSCPPLLLHHLLLLLRQLDLHHLHQRPLQPLL